MSESDFNRAVVVGLFAFFGLLYLISFALNKPVDWQGLLVFIVPTINAIVHQFTQAQVASKSIEANTVTTVATLQKPNSENNTPPAVPIVKP